ncbi:MAG: hypothetical protein QXY36_01025 [Sulfolobales archaeon]
MVCKVLLDSSVLLQVYEGIDVIDLISDELGWCDYYVLDAIINELSKISLSSKSLKGGAARLALEYVRRRGVKVINTGAPNTSGDESILLFFKRDPKLREEFIVATNDDMLKRELLRLHVKVITWWSSKFKYVVLGA